MKTVIRSTLVFTLALTTTFSTYANDRADEAKKAFDKLTSETQALYGDWEDLFFFDKLSVETTDYQVGDSQSTATQIVNMGFKETDDEEAPKEIKTTVNYTITYSDELAKQGIVTRIKTTKVAYSGKDATEEMEEMAQSIMGENTATDIYQNGDMHSQMISEDKNLEIHWRGKLDDLSELYGTFDGVVVNTHSETKDKITFKGKNDAQNGFIAETTSPIKTEFEGTKTAIESVIIKNKLTKVDGLDFPLAQTSMAFNGVKAEAEDGMTVSYDTFVINFDSTESNKGGVNASVNIHMKPNGDWIQTLSQGLVNLSNIKAKWSLDNLPKSLSNQYAKMFMTGLENTGANSVEMMEAAYEQHGEQWIAEIQKLGLGSTLSFSFESDKGNGFLDLAAHFNDVGYTDEMLKDMQPTPEALLTLLNINGKSSLPAKLIEDAQLQMFLAMAYQKKGDAYVTNIETKEKQLLVNDVPFDLSMILPELGKSDENDMDLLEEETTEELLDGAEVEEGEAESENTETTQ